MKRAHRRAHGWLATVLAVALPLILLGALAVRQDPTTAPPPERIEAPR